MQYGARSAWTYGGLRSEAVVADALTKSGRSGADASLEEAETSEGANEVQEGTFVDSR